MTEEYNFDNYVQILDALNALPDDKKKEYNAQMSLISVAAKEFLKTRKNSELMDIADLEPTIYDYMGSFLEWYDEEVDSRSWPTETDVAKAARRWDPNWSGDNEYLLDRFLELEKQTKGIQKKLDRVIKLLEGTKVTMSVEEALKL